MLLRLLALAPATHASCELALDAAPASQSLYCTFIPNFIHAYTSNEQSLNQLMLIDWVQEDTTTSTSRVGNRISQ